MMDHCVGKMMRDRGITPEKLRKALESVPVFDEVLIALREAHALGAKLVVLSDANTWFIEKILSHLGIRDIFSLVLSNRATWDEDDQRRQILRIRPFHSHRCERCPPNLCKGLVLQKLLRDDRQRRRVVYLGDGGGDFCPCVSLCPGNLICARAGWTLHKKMLQAASSGESGLAEVATWKDGSDILKSFRRYFRGCPADGGDDCKRTAARA